MKIHLLTRLILLACFALTGCAGVHNSMRPSGKNSSWNPLSRLTETDKSKKSQKDAKPPETMSVIWTDSVFEQPGTSPVRGFGGRIFFYDSESTAVKAEGELVVYGFDDTDETVGVKTNKADRKFVFPSEKLQSHFSQTDLGASYSVWIPWEIVGGNRKTVTLIPVFKTADGRVLKSGQSMNVLPGKTLDANVNVIGKTGAGSPKSKIAQSNGIKLAGFESAAGDADEAFAQAALNEENAYNQIRIRTSTINVNPALASRMAMSENVPKAHLATVVENRDAAPATKLNSPLAPMNSERSASNPKLEHDAASVEPSPVAIESAKNSSPRKPSVFGSPGAFR